jgi:hypothetical protein
LMLAAGDNSASPASTSAPGAATWQRFTSIGLFVSATVPTGPTTATSASPVSAQFSGFSVLPVTASGQSATGAAR